MVRFCWINGPTFDNAAPNGILNTAGTDMSLLAPGDPVVQAPVQFDEPLESVGNEGAVIPGQIWSNSLTGAIQRGFAFDGSVETSAISNSDGGTVSWTFPDGMMLTNGEVITWQSSVPNTDYYVYVNGVNVATVTSTADSKISYDQSSFNSGITKVGIGISPGQGSTTISAIYINGDIVVDSQDIVLGALRWSLPMVQTCLRWLQVTLFNRVVDLMKHLFGLTKAVVLLLMTVI